MSCVYCFDRYFNNAGCWYLEQRRISNKFVPITCQCGWPEFFFPSPRFNQILKHKCCHYRVLSCLKNIYICTIQHSTILWHLLNMKCCLKDPMMLSRCDCQLICASPLSPRSSFANEVTLLKKLWCQNANWRLVLPSWEDFRWWD